MTLLPGIHSFILQSLCLAIFFAATTSAQLLSVVPTNQSLPNVSGDVGMQLQLRTAQTGMIQMTQVIPLTAAAGYGGSLSDLQNINVTGKLVLVDASSASSLSSDQIAYMSCDDSTYYPGKLTAAGVFNIVTQTNPASVVLYSNVSDHCSITLPYYETYKSIYSMVGSGASNALANGIKSNTGTQSVANISLNAATVPSMNTTLNNTMSGSNNGNNVLGPSPTTAVAMIILYSITGVITALFLVIIVTGAVRAHRHPERYGPRNVLGRPRQSRAKGIARAMLETIPIVKFGEHHDNKPAGQDVELGDAGTTRNTEPAAVGAATNEAVNQPSVSGDTVETSETTTAAGALPAEGETTAAKDEGLGCSICTEDFVKGENIRLLPCNHKFHPVCIDPWLLNVSGTCPLCRVDLRPAATNPADLTVGADSTGSNELPPPLAAVENSTEGGARPRGGLSHFFNIRRMRDATPEERVDAIRSYRRALRERQANAGSRRGSRLSGAFRDSFRRRSDVPDMPEGSAPQSANPDVVSPISPVAESARSGTFAG
ncbi:MAG: hypothetical protein M1836_002143 [Candelina mexicana]|nr:MAG: hypothetical protein M1836_002143 [Candelina mexicana]